jgi:tRNA 5-methylaminomethyl-2-thiouridine biosynthesis bifunctional protein
MPDRRASKRTLLDFARLDWEGAAPRSRDADDVYFSGDGASETRHVFLDGNDLPARFANARRIAVGELGFGSGLNFLATVDLWKRSAKPSGARLRYLSVERAPFAPADLERAHRAWPELAELAATLRAVLPPPTPGTHRMQFDAGVSLTLLYGEADDVLPGAEAAIDAWHLDGFAPSKNPDLWSPHILDHVARLSAPNATLATYTVAGAVRRALEAAGFVVEKRAGYGRKKEMLAGRLARANAKRVRAPWFDLVRAPAPDPTETRVAIIGGGVAGASLAFAARRAGCEAVIFERAAIGAGASGNPAGLVMPRLDLGETPTARFFLEAYLYTDRLLRGLDGVFNPCGVRLAAEDDEGRGRLARIAAANLLPPDMARLESDALFLPRAGVVDPPRLLAMLVDGARIVTAPAERIVRDKGGIRIHAGGALHGPFQATVLANGADALRFVEARGLPLSTVAGQIDFFPDAPTPKGAIAFGPYAAPAPTGGLVIGATYDQFAPAIASVNATRRNIAAVARQAPDLAARLDPEQSRPRASLRCQTPDRLPVAGALPDLGFYAGEYDGLRTGLRRDYPRGEGVPGVYVLSGLGSRGLVTAPLLAEVIVADIAGAPSPVSADIAEALHPARFFIRDLKRSGI